MLFHGTPAHESWVLLPVKSKVWCVMKDVTNLNGLWVSQKAEKLEYYFSRSLLILDWSH